MSSMSQQTTVPIPVTTRTRRTTSQQEQHSHSGHVLMQDFTTTVFYDLHPRPKNVIHNSFIYFDCGFDSSTTSTTLLPSHCSNSSGSSK